MRRGLVIAAALLVLLGAWLWVRAGTNHTESLPSSGALVAERVDSGPDRLPAELAWAGAAACVVAAVAIRRR